jgi:hypothetical protein
MQVKDRAVDPTSAVSIDIFVYGVEPIDVWLGWSDEAQFKGIGREVVYT